MGKLISTIFFLCLFALGLFVYKDYGISFDEPAQRLIGITNLNHVARHFNHQAIINNDSLTQFPKKLDQITDRDYGVIFELPAAFMEHALDLKLERDIYFARHLLTFLFFLAGVISVYCMAQRRFNDWRIGLLAATFLIKRVALPVIWLEGGIFFTAILLFEFLLLVFALAVRR